MDDMEAGYPQLGLWTEEGKDRDLGMDASLWPCVPAGWHFRIRLPGNDGIFHGSVVRSLCLVPGQARKLISGQECGKCHKEI